MSDDLRELSKSEVVDRMHSLRVRVAELEAALAFYADEATYREVREFKELPYPPIVTDHGYRARAALGAPKEAQ